MKVKEAIEILKQMDPNKEVQLKFDGTHSSNRHGDPDYSDCPPGSTCPCESQSERFGNR